MRITAVFPFLALAAVLAPGSLSAGLSVSVSSSTPGLPLVGQPTRWTVGAFAAGFAPLQYRFQLTDRDGNLVIQRTFGSSPFLDWIPLVEGDYFLTADIVNPATGESAQAQSAFTVVSDLSSPEPSVAPSLHPLVAVYTAACNSGKMRVLFSPAGQGAAGAQATPFSDCQPGKDIAFLVAGLQPDTDYSLWNEVTDAGNSQTSSAIVFHSGVIPDDLAIPLLTVESRDRASSQVEQVILESVIAKPGAVAFDNSGVPIWYYYDPNLRNILLLRPVPGGGMFLVASDGSVLRRVDLAGTVLREISVGEASRQLQAMNLPAITGFNHDAILLPDGSTAVLASLEQFADQGDGPVDVDGDMVLVLDPQWRVSWAWNPFDKLDLKRKAVLGEQCSGPCATLARVANDWTHANSLDYTADGNLLVSLRSLDWVIKIDYRDGQGGGDVLWRLGRYGDFTLADDAGDPFPWFSHQHFATLRNGMLTLFDNGNTRVAEMHSGNSRGQVWAIDETARTASLLLNADLGTYSFAIGSAQKLANGDYEFLSGFIPTADGFRSEATEVAADPKPDGAARFIFSAPLLTYRTFRMKDLYTP